VQASVKRGGLPRARAAWYAARMQIGTIAALWRYPVKSLRGEALGQITIGPFGVPGDRAFALRDVRDGRIMSAKKTAALLALRAGYPSGPTRPAVIELADGRRLGTDAPDTPATLASVLGREIEVCSSHDQQEDRRVEGEEESTFDAPPFAFVDLAPIHVLTTASLRAIAARQPDSRFDPRRFRPNLLVECGERSDFVEDAMDGKLLAVGAEVRLRVFMPTIRCAMTMRAQEELPADPSVLRTVVEQHGGNLGVYATVEAPGEVRLGDPVRVLDE
jgi:uncharacterized protein YcbX